MLSAKLQKILAAQRTSAMFPCLIKITHPNYAAMYFANSSMNIIYNNNIYNSASFSIDPPEREGAKIGSATLTMSAVDQFWIQRIREINTPAKLQFIASIIFDEANGSTGIEPLEENDFTCRAANWNELSITWDLVFDERQKNIITSMRCIPLNVPGCA